jgi:predicted nucleic acid-binding protein
VANHGVGYRSRTFLSDPDNDLVIACAVVGEAEVVVRGDKDLPAPERAGDIPIPTVAQSLRCWDRAVDRCPVGGEL